MIKRVLIFATLALAWHLTAALDNSVPRPIFLQPSTTSSDGVFSDLPISNIYELPDGSVTYVGSNGVYVANISSREIRQSFLEGKKFSSAVFIKEKNWWLAATEGCHHILKLSYGTDLDICNEGYTFTYPLTPTSYKILDDKNLKVLLYSRNYYIEQVIGLSDGIKISENSRLNMIGNGPGVILMNERLVNWIPDSPRLYVRPDPSVTDSDKTITLSYSVNDVKSVSKSVVVKSNDANCLYLIYTWDSVTETLKLTDTLNTKLNARDKTKLSSLGDIFSISQGNLVEFYTIDGNGKAQLKYSSTGYLPFDGLIDYVGSALGSSSFFIKNSESRKLTLVSRNDWAPISDSFVISPISYEQFAEVPQSDLYDWNGKFTFRGPIRLMVVDAQRKPLKTLKLVKGEDPIISAYYMGQGKWAVGYVGKILIVDLETEQIQTLDQIEGVTSEVLGLYVVPGTQNLVIHQSKKLTILFDLSSQKVLGTFSTLLKPDRVPIFLGNSMILYTTTNNYGEVFNLTSTALSPVRWDHRYTPGINYIKIVKSNLIFVQTLEANTRYELWNTDTLLISDKLSISYPSSTARIHSFIPGSTILVNNENQVDIFSVSANGLATLKFSKKEYAFEDIFCIGSQSYNYIQVMNGFEVREIDTTLYSVKANLFLEDNTTPGIFSSGVKSNVKRIRNSNLHTYVNERAIVIVCRATERVVRSFIPYDSPIEASYYSAENDMWILGYNQKMLTYNVITGALTNYKGGTAGKIKELYRVPGTNKILIHQRNVSFILHDFDTKQDKLFIGNVIPDRDPIFSGQIMIVYSSYSSSVEIFNLTSESLTPIVWKHAYINEGINYITRVGTQNLLLVQTVSSKLTLWDSFIMKHLANITTSLAKPRIYGLYTANNHFILSADGVCEYYQLDSASGQVKLIDKKTGFVFSDIYYVDFSKNFILANELLSVSFADLATLEVIYSFAVFKINVFYHIPLSNIVGYPVSHAGYGHIDINEVSLTNGKHLKEYTVKVEGDVVQIEPISDNYNALIIRTTLKTYIFDKNTEKHIAELEASNAALSLPFQETIIFQSSTDNVIRLYNWRRKEFLNQQRYIKDSLGAYVYNEKVVSFVYSPRKISFWKYDVVALIQKAGKPQYYANFASFEDTENPEFNSRTDPTFDLKKTIDSCSKLVAFDAKIYSCSDDSTTLTSFLPGSQAYDTTYQITTFQTRKIVDFEFGYKVKGSKPVIGILTAPKDSTGDLELELWDNSNNKFISKTIIPGVTEGKLFYSGTFKVLKTGSYYNAYDTTLQCQTDEVVLNAANGDSNQYCYKKCDGKRVIFGAQRCANVCPSNKDTEDKYLGAAENGNVCIPVTNYASEVQPIPVYNISLTFDTYLNKTTLNNTLCRLSQLISLPNIRKDGVSCSMGATSRLLQQVQIPFINSSVYFFEVFSHWALADQTLDYLNSILPKLPAIYNQGLNFTDVQLLNAQLFNLVTTSLKPKTNDDLRVNILKISKKEQIQVTVNVSHPNVIAYLAWSENSPTATTPTVDSMRNLLDGNGLPLSGLRSLQSLDNGTVVFTLSKEKYGRVDYAFFTGAEYLEPGNYLKSVVLRVNQSIDGDQEWGYAPGYSSYSSIVSIPVLALLCLIFANLLQ